MDPISSGLGIIGMGMQIFGGFGAASAAAHQAEISKAKYGEEANLSAYKETLMEVQARRQNTEILRNSQRARAMALQSATNQGAQFGSGLQGGYGQISGQTNNNLWANQASLEAGRVTYATNNRISGLNMQMADAQSDQATAQGWQSLGSAISGSSGKIGQMAQGFGSSSGFGDPLGGFGGSSRWSLG